MSFSSKRVRLTFKHFITWTENCYIYCKKKKSPGCTILCLIPAIFFLFIRWNLTIRSGVSWEQNCLSLFQEAEENTCRTQRGGSHCFLFRTSFFSWREMSFFFCALCFRCPQTQTTLPLVVISIFSSPRVIRSKARGCGLSLRTKSCMCMQQVRWMLI